VIVDLDELREQTQNLHDCLDRLKNNMDILPDNREAVKLQSMIMTLSLQVLDSHIKELEKLESIPSVKG
jgi:hypothetical protein